MKSARLDAFMLIRSWSGSGSKSSSVNGLNPYTTSNGHNLVVEWTTRLLANSTCGRQSSHSLRFFLIIVLKSIDLEGAVHYLNLSNCLCVARDGEKQFRAKLCPQGLPKITHKIDIAVGDNGLGHSMQSHNFPEKQVRCM